MDTKLRRIADSLGVTFPKEVLDQLGLKEGDTMNIIVTEEGIQLIPSDPNFDAVMAAYKEGKTKYRNAMKKLADG